MVCACKPVPKDLQFKGWADDDAEFAFDEHDSMGKMLKRGNMKDAYNIVAKGIAENKSTYEIAKDLEKYVQDGWTPGKKLQ